LRIDSFARDSLLALGPIAGKPPARFHFLVTSTPLSIRIAIWAWLIVALLVGNSSLLRTLPMPAIQGILFALTAVCLGLYFKVRALRTWIDGLDLRALALLHITRFVGIYFLVLYRRGELPYAFAVPGGWGDIIVAGLALLVCLLPMTAGVRLRALTIWNVIGFVDIMLVVVAAGRLAVQGNLQMRALTYLPLSLLPTFLVPLIIASHVIIFLRLRRESNSA
jgi:hypothetical protein